MPPPMPVIAPSRTAGTAPTPKSSAFVAPVTQKRPSLGVLSNGEGRTVMLRADMDALPIKEATDLPYASKATATDRDGNTVPVMHACGHDMHVTWLVGATTLLARGRDTWRGTLM